MRILCFLLLIVSMGCAPLKPHDSAWGDVGEVAFRAVVFPLTLGTSELMYAMEYDKRKQAEQVQQAWPRKPVFSLTACLERYSAEYCEQEQARQAELRQQRQYAHELELQRTKAMGMALSGGGFKLTPIPQPPPVQPTPVTPFIMAPRPQSCTSQVIGNSIYSNCY